MLKLLLLLVFFVVALWGVRELLSWRSGRGEFPCRTCRHCRRLESDGVMCGYGEKTVFKTPAQIAMCPDHTPR